MGNDHIDFSGDPYRAGNNFSLSLHPESKEMADQYFQRLSDGGTVTMPMSTAPWGDYFGMFTDKFGMKWMINYRSK
jgi:PhnB protein